MARVRAKKNNLSSRRALVKELFVLGLSDQEIATALRVTMATVHNDLTQLRAAGSLQDVPWRRYRKTVVFYLALKRYAEVTAHSEQRTLQRALTSYIGVEEITQFLNGATLTLKKLLVPAHREEQQGYLKLLTAVFGLRATLGKGGELAPDAKAVWQEFLKGAAEGTCEAPLSRTALCGELAGRLLAQHRADIAPLWPEDVATIVDEQLTTLTNREATVLRRRFGLEGKPERLKTIGQNLGVSRAAVNRAEAQGLRKLRLPERAKHLERLLAPVGDALRQQLLAEAAARRFEERSTAFAEGEDTTVDGVTLQFPVLMKRLDELEFSVRTMNCLVNLNLTYVGDLVQLTEQDLYLTRMIGRKSLREVAEVLCDLGLRLGIRFSDRMKQLFEEARANQRP